jgi:hypothetical protein
VFVGVKMATVYLLILSGPMWGSTDYIKITSKRETKKEKTNKGGGRKIQAKIQITE